MSPARTTTAPEACLASLPVSNEISVPPISTETRVTSDICSFLLPARRWRALCIFQRFGSRCIQHSGATLGTPPRMCSAHADRLRRHRLHRAPVAERLVAHGRAPGAGRARPSAGSRELAERLGARSRPCEADATAPRTRSSRLVEPGDVLVSHRRPVRASGASPPCGPRSPAGATYIDSTGEPAFIRRVFEEFGAPAAPRRAWPCCPRWASTSCPGTLAGALALEDAGRAAAARVDVGYYSLGAGADAASARARSESLVGRDARPDASRAAAARIVTARGAERVRTFAVKGKRAAGDLDRRRRALHAARPPIRALREVNVYLGWFGPLSRAMQAGVAGRRRWPRRLPGRARGCRFTGEKLARHDARRARPSRAPRRLAVLDRGRRLRRGGRAAGRGRTSPAPTATTSPRASSPGRRARAASTGVHGRRRGWARCRRSASTRCEIGCAEAGLTRLRDSATV